MAVGAGGLLTATGPAHSAPCTSYRFGGDFSWKESTGWMLSANSSGEWIRGDAYARHPDGNSSKRGKITGRVIGREVTMVVDWPEGAQGQYKGNVGNDGFVHGHVYVTKPREASASWDSTVALACADAATPAPPSASTSSVTTSRTTKTLTHTSLPSPSDGRADSDGDGLYDDDETNVYGTDPAKADTDGDGDSDGLEVYRGTDPKN